MNEVQLIRAQLAVERAHASAVADACAAAAAGERDRPGAPPAEFTRACVEYLACVLAWFEERDQRTLDFAHALAPGEAAVRRALEEALARPGRSRETLEKLERAVTGTAAEKGASGLWQEFARYFAGLWRARREAIDARLGEGLRRANWRVVAGIDADSILEERRRYARVRATLPVGVALAESDSAGPPER